MLDYRGRANGYGTGVSIEMVEDWRNQARLAAVNAKWDEVKYRRYIKSGAGFVLGAFILSLLFYPAIPAFVVGLAMIVYYYHKARAARRESLAQSAERDKWANVREVW